MKKVILLEELKKKLAGAIKEDDVSEIKELASFLRIPKNETDEYYVQNKYTGYASVDKPHIKYLKKGTLDAEFPKMKMFDYLYLKTKKYATLTALNFYGRKISFDELYSKIEDTAKAFLKMGVKEGDNVVISMPTTPEAVYMLFALNRIGAVAVELDPRTGVEDIVGIIKESQTTFYITMEDCSPIIDKMLKVNPDIDSQLKNVMFVSPTESLPFGMNYMSDLKDKIDRIKGVKPVVPTGYKYIDWNGFIVNGRNYTGKIDSLYKPDAVTEIIFSSGTTATPKPIKYTNETFTSMVRQIELGENAYKVGDKNLDIIPLFLGFGSNNGLYAVLCFGVEDILIPVPVIDNLPTLINKYKPNHLLGAPIHMKVLLKYLQNNPKSMKDLSYIKSIVSGSSYLESVCQYALDTELAKRGCRIKVGPGYGQNEGGPTLSFSTDTFLEIQKPGCSGFPLPFTTISIFDLETDEELQYGKDLEGEIRYITPSSMQGYAFGREKETSEYFKQGKDGKIWSCSGDLGKIDSDGGIYITGRIARQLHRNGFKFSPTEIEELVTQNISAIETCALIGIEDDEEEMKTILYYSLRDDQSEYSSIIREQVIALCSTLKDYKIPCEYVERVSMPYTKNQKLDFQFLEQEAIAENTVKRKVLSLQ